MTTTTEKKDEPPKLDVRKEAFKLYAGTSNWRECWQGLRQMGVRDPEAKRAAKAVNCLLRPRPPKKRKRFPTGG